MSVRVTDRSSLVLQGAINGARRGVHAGALIILTLMQARTPVRTGNLRRSENIQVEENGTKISAKIGPNTSYAAYVELGTRHMAAQPYIRPAFDTGREEAIQVIRENIAQGIRGALA